MADGGRRQVGAGALSMLLPGAGHVYAGARRRGVALLAASGVLVAALLVVAVVRPFAAAALVDRRAAAALLALNLALLAFRLFAVVDAWRYASRAASRLAVATLAALAAVTAVPHVAAGYVTVRGYSVLESVFADAEPQEARVGPLLAAAPVSRALPGRPPDARPAARRARPQPVPAPLDVPRERLTDSPHVVASADEAARYPWVTLLLLGSDAGPDQWGERTDTMIAVALQRETRRAVAFGIPRNLVEVPLASAERADAPARFREPLNALYAYARARPELFPGGADPGATALKAAVSHLLGMRVDYYALVDLAGFADVVDALGGAEIHVKERLVDEVTRPRWGVPKPRIDVHPGRTYRFSGMQALAYVRSRKGSSDYARMARQRCFLSALTNGVDAVTVLRNFGTLAKTIERNVRTDIPLTRVPDLVGLATAVDPGATLTETFGPEYFAGRRASDRYPIPDVEEIRATVRETVLHPRVALDEGRATAASRAC